MKSLFRSLHYLWPYRKRLGVSIVCIVFIAALWGGGLGMIVPGTKILLSPEGLHGWAWISLSEDKLDVTLVSRKAKIPSLDPKTTEEILTETLSVTKINKDGASDGSIINDTCLIVGLIENGERKIIHADNLARQIAHTKLGQKLQLLIYDYNQDSGKFASASITLSDATRSSQLLGRVADNIAEPADQAGRFAIWVWLLAAVMATTIVRNILRFIQEYLVATAVWRGMLDLRCDNYNVALRLPISFYSRQGTADTMSRFIQDTNELARGQITLFGKTLAEPAKAVASIAMALLLDWQLTLAAMIAGPVVIVLIRKFGKIMKKASRKALESWASLLAILEETLSGIRVVKAYTMEGAERKRFVEENRRLFKQQKRMSRVNSATAPTVEMLGFVAVLAAAGWAGHLVFNSQMDPEIFIAWMACLAAMFDPVRKLAKVATRFQRADAAAQRVFQLQDEPQEKQLPGAVSLDRHSKDIEFKNVHFRYPQAAQDALCDINLSIGAGQTVAIVGPNGCGKTTLVSLLPRLFDATAGEIYIDGQNIAKTSLRSLRRQIGVVTQETVLFHATVAENIAYGLAKPKLAKVLEAAKKAYVNEFIEDLPDGFDTMVGAHGATLSGGQRQRIAIARAILRDPAILIFDEATSQVDADSEHRIHLAMDEFIRGRTTFMIAHRFATVLSADMIIVMNAGEIVGIGTHDELLKNCKLYRHLYRTQFVDSGGDAAGEVGEDDA